jgi:hypothetical protein
MGFQAGEPYDERAAIAAPRDSPAALEPRAAWHGGKGSLRAVKIAMRPAE